MRFIILTLILLVLWVALIAGILHETALEPKQVATRAVQTYNDRPPRMAAPTTTTTTTSTTVAPRARTAPTKPTPDVPRLGFAAGESTPDVWLAPSKRATGDVPAIIRAGFARFGSVVAEQAVRVASCETGGTFDPAARNGAHFGLFQISRTYHDARVRRLGFTWERMIEARPNAAVAVDLYAEQGWQPWSCRWAA